MCDLADVLAESDGSGYVIAPAGYGKTYLIAKTTSRSVGRQLILTHTHAGVNALRRKMGILGVSDRSYQIDTIASWVLKLALSYSGTSGWHEERPVGHERWRALYVSCSDLLDHEFIRRIVRASYARLYVDEYQDCSTAQHEIVDKLARVLPCTILGDPLQGIFDFAGQNSIDWARDVEGNFDSLGALDTPHRWRQVGADDLGDWLNDYVRDHLERNQPIDLNRSLPAAVRVVQPSADPQELFRVQSNTCRYFECDLGQTVVAIHSGRAEYKAKCHTLSHMLSGRFSSIEEIEGSTLFSFIRKMGEANGAEDRLKEVVVFAKKCMTGVGENLPAPTVRGERVNIRTNTRNPEVARLANDYLAAPASASMAGFLVALKRISSINVTREDLLNRALGVLAKHMVHPELSLEEAAEMYQREFRHCGRPVGRRKLIGTTLLVKGLEFDHAIVLDATSLSRKELYVALTRGARSLTIISTEPVLDPRD